MGGGKKSAGARRSRAHSDAGREAVSDAAGRGAEPLSLDRGEMVLSLWSSRGPLGRRPRASLAPGRAGRRRPRSVHRGSAVLDGGIEGAGARRGRALSEIRGGRRLLQRSRAVDLRRSGGPARRGRCGRRLLACEAVQRYWTQLPVASTSRSPGGRRGKAETFMALVETLAMMGKAQVGQEPARGGAEHAACRRRGRRRR